jgi:hypothetical protein
MMLDESQMYQFALVGYCKKVSMETKIIHNAVRNNMLKLAQMNTFSCTE